MFWDDIKKPFFVLAPMADVTDAAFRAIIAKYSKPAVLWTEFVSCDGLASSGRERLLTTLAYSSNERPIVAQIFGSNPDHFYTSAKLISKLKFDGIDINMGCPDRKVEKQSAGAALIKNLPLAIEIINATKKGSGSIPVSVKTRLGYSHDITEELVEALLTAKPALITLHARTRKQMSKVPADWEAIKRAVNVRNLAKSKTYICGNGDVDSIQHARQLAQKTKADGIMLGRAIFGNPWLFSGINRNDVPVNIRLKVLVEHSLLYEKMYKGEKKFNLMKKHFKGYVAGFRGAKELREKLMKANTASEVKRITHQYNTGA